jgi:hypothetical protein
MVSSGATLTLPELRARKVVFFSLLIPQPDWDKYHLPNLSLQCSMAAGHDRAVQGRSATVEKSWYPFYPSLAALNTLLVPVAYRSPILIAAVFARPTSLCAPQRVERSDPIARMEATRGPRRLKGLVMGTQGDGERPAAGSRRRSLGEKYRTT